MSRSRSQDRPRRPPAHRRPRRRGAERRQPHRQRAGAALLLRDRDCRASNGRRFGAGGREFVAAAHRQASTRQRRHAARGRRIPQRALSADRRQAPYEEYHDDIAGLYRCGDGRWVRLHTNLPHHCSGLLALLQCPHDKSRRAARARRLAGRGAGDRRRRGRPRRHRVPIVRRMGSAIRKAARSQNLPLFTIERIGDAPAAAAWPRPSGR